MVLFLLYNFCVDVIYLVNKMFWNCFLLIGNECLTFNQVFLLDERKEIHNIANRKWYIYYIDTVKFP